MHPTFFLVYPFHHNYAPNDLTSGQGLPGRWMHWLLRLDDKSFEAAVDHAYSFIPPVRAMLAPEFVGMTAPPNDWRSSATLAELRHRFASAAGTTDAANRYANKGLRVTYRDAPWLRSEASLEDAVDGATIGAPFQVQWADVILFPEHVGVICLKVELMSSDLDTIATMSRYLKKVEFRRRLSVHVPNVRLADGSLTNWSRILDELTDGLSRDEAPRVDKLGRREHSATAGVNWRVAAFVPNVDGQQKDLQRIAFHVATGRGPSQLLNEPTAKHMSNISTESCLEIWETWTALHHYDNLVFVAAAVDERLAQEAIAHLEIFEHEYLLVFIYAVCLRLALELLATEVAATPPSTGKAVQHTGQVYASLMRFNTRMWFNQIGTSPIGPHMFDMLRRCMALPGLYRQVWADAQTLTQYLDSRASLHQARTAERAEGLLQFLSIVAIPLGAVITILQPTLFDARGIRALSPLTAWALLAVLSVAASLAWFLLRTTRRESDDEL
jgi:hypothetical protein